MNFSAKPGPAEGQWPEKPGQRVSLWIRSPSSGTEITRAQNSAPKNPAKNMTSEKMNQLMPQRNDMSTCLEYWPVSDSRITSPNQRYSMYKMITVPSASDTQPALMPLKTNTAPSAMQNRPTEPMMGHGIGCGM